MCSFFFPLRIHLDGRDLHQLAIRGLALTDESLKFLEYETNTMNTKEEEKF